MERDLKWAHPASDTYFDTLLDLATITVNLTHSHSYKGTWKTREGAISVPLSGNITQLIQMLLWNHPYVESTSFLQGTTAYNATLGDRIQIPLNSEIRTLGSTAQKLIIHLLLPHRESGHLDLTSRAGKLLMEEILVGTKQNYPETNRVTTWSHDGGEAQGILGVQILGGHKPNPYPASLMPPQRLRVTIIDYCMNLHTPWPTNMRPASGRLLILGNPYSKAIDLQIPTQQGQTCIDVILLTLQVIGGQKDRIRWEIEGIQAFTPNHRKQQGLRHPSPTWWESTGLYNISHHSILANYMKPNGRLTMFLPQDNDSTIWESACLAEDTKIRMADGTFSKLLNSAAKQIWTDQQGTRKIRRIHKFDTLETDPPLYGIGGNWMTGSHYIWGRMDSKRQRALEYRGVNKAKRKNSKEPVYAVELDTDD